MQRTRFFLATSILAVTSSALWAAGCGTFREDCVTGGLCEPYNPGSARACTGDPTVDPSLISDKCGLFVRADEVGNDTAPGTREQPLKTIQAAVNNVDKQWIFVCSSNPVQEKVTIGKDNVAIFGGFDCANGWAWAAGSKTTLQGIANAATLTITGQGADVRDFTIQGVDAIAESASSIAVLVSKANPTFTRCDMIAGKAKDGEPGDSIQPASAPSGQDGNPGADACSLAIVPGGEQATNDCPGAEISLGGQGGDGTALNGAPGVAGSPDNLGGGKPGEGEPATATTPPWSCATVGDGKPGGPGGIGLAGAGATVDLSLGSLTVDGFVSADGQDGKPGQPGQGGGGGGAAKGGSACTGATKGGAGGGSGASGGCGGIGGRGGQGAGASIALVSLASPGIILKDVTLTAADGARGGDGGDAQRGGEGGTNGGTGGKGGFNLNGGCEGGAGGPGGDGGTGGGGRGGHSIGVAYTDNPPALETTKIVFGAPGEGGLGGNLDLLKNHGDPGIAAATQSFSAPK